MPTVHVEAGCRFVIYTDDHAPAHVHILVGDGELVIRLKDSFVREAINVKASEVKKALRLTEANRDKLYAAWFRIHGEDKGRGE
jgi:hypothetical protein